MPVAYAPAWDGDAPDDLPRVAANAGRLLKDLAERAPQQPRASAPTRADLCRWHALLHAGCAVPVPGYLGHVRGDATVPELVGYEVGIGPTLADGYPEKVGVWSADLDDALDAFLAAARVGLTRLDRRLPPGRRATTTADLSQVVQLAALVHGESVRLHPFANGNGRTARLFAAFVALRYGVPVFAAVHSRPDDVAYLLAAKASMGRPPDFVGDHRPATAVFARLLARAVLS